ncbi:MAG: NAD(+)/NADH kinase [Lachnospiraceae bacterium]|nr:NAD(+)/NADH kinase [Lachnospiraceae bacterium]
MKTFCVISNPDKDVQLTRAGHVKRYLESKGCTCYIESKSYVDQPEIQDGTEAVLVIGGDGTMLKAARDLAGYDLPLLGINLGTVGYLAEIEIGAIESALDKVMADEYHIEERMMLEGDCGKQEVALNDIVVSRNGPLQVMSYNVYVNGQFLNGYQADGIIVATPTGSTGYNMSAGGPVVEPTANILVVTPICPHTLNTRSIILSPEDEIRIEVPEGRMGMKQRLQAYFDGGSHVELETGDSLTIYRSKRTTKIMRLSKISFLETLHKKLQ